MAAPSTSATDPDLERRIVEEGKRLLAAARGEAEGARPVDRWLEHLLERVMEDESFRVQASLCFGSSPQYLLVVVPARAAYSHSASVGSRNCPPIFLDSQAAYSWASCQDTLMTGRRCLWA
jgi:hypothetical protein